MITPSYLFYEKIHIYINASLGIVLFPLGFNGRLFSDVNDNRDAFDEILDFVIFFCYVIDGCYK